jgi:histidinol phosphatase-like PHP family hydrolase
MKDDGLHVDWHCHSTWSDGSGSVPALVGLARKRGMTIGISDHALSDNRRLCEQDQIEEYLANLRQYPVLRGLEISVGDLGRPRKAGQAGLPDLPGCDVDLASLNAAGELDYVIASLHSVYIPEGRVHATRYLNYRAGLYPGYKRSLQRYRRRSFFETWLRDLDATARRWPVTILGHFCLLPELAKPDAIYKLEDDPKPDGEAAEFLDATIRLCIRHDVAIEINSKSRVPHASFIGRALELGARFSLGSDTHRLQHCGELPYSRMMVERFRIPPNRLLRLRDVRPDFETTAAPDEQAAG